MNRPSLVALLLVALTLALLLLELGQLPVAGQASGARVFGVVEGYAPCDGLAPLQNAMVAATAGLNTSFTTTDPSGNYAFYLPAGTYNLTASAAGYVAQSEQITSAGAGSAITLNFYLEQSAAVTCTSQTATEVQITVDSSPEQGTGLVMVDSVIISTPVTYTWVVGSQHTINAAIETRADADCSVHNCQYVFQSWSDGGDRNRTITANVGSAEYTAFFTKQNYILVGGSPRRIRALT